MSFPHKRSGLDILAILVVAGLSALAWHLAETPEFYNVLSVAVIVISIIIIIHEFTVKRYIAPTVGSNFIDRRHLTHIIQKAVNAQPAGKLEVVDLGSGRGGLARRIARAVPRVRVTGVEISHTPHMIAVFMQRLRGFKNLTHQQMDMFDYDCRKANIIVMYLNFDLAKLSDKLQRELKPGATVISLQFPLIGWAPERVETYRNPLKMTVYIYRKA